MDDTNLLITQRDESVLHHKVNEVTYKLEYWFQKNNLMINNGKTVAISFHTKHSVFPIIRKITFSNMDNVYKSESKFLGNHITKKFEMESSCTFIKFKTEQSILFIKPFNKIMSSCIIRTIYHSKFQSLLRYIIIFGGVIMKVYSYLS